MRQGARRGNSHDAGSWCITEGQDLPPKQTSLKRYDHFLRWGMALKFFSRYERKEAPHRTPDFGQVTLLPLRVGDLVPVEGSSQALGRPLRGWGGRRQVGGNPAALPTPQHTLTRPRIAGVPTALSTELSQKASREHKS